MDTTRLCYVVGASALVCLVGLVLLAAATRPSPQSMPAAQAKGTLSLEEVLARRRSVRNFKPEALKPEQIAQLCWAAQGVTDAKSGKRTCPSAGALYPLELDVVTAEGVCRYAPVRHSLDRRLEGDLRGRLAAAALRQSWVEEAPVVFVISAVVPRTERKYGDRARRYVHMEAGHAGQNLLLQAEALGLGAVPVGAFDDKDVAKLLALRADEEPLYLIPVGRPAEAGDRRE